MLEIVSHFVGLAGLELILWTRMALNSEISDCLCLPVLGLKLHIRWVLFSLSIWESELVLLLVPGWTGWARPSLSLVLYKWP